MNASLSKAPGQLELVALAPAPLARRRRPWLLLAVTSLLLFIVLAPVLVVVAGSVLNTSFMGLSSEQWVGDGSDAHALFTTKWFGYVFETYRPQLVMSLQLAFASVVGCILLGVPAAYLLVRGNFPGRRALEELIMLPLALPGIVVSIALIQAYIVIRGSWFFVLLGHLLYTLPFMVRSVASALRAFDVATLERAAESLGASRWQRFRFIVLPNLRHSVTLGSLLVFAVSFGEFNVSFLLCTPLTATFPNALYAAYTFSSFQVSSAATVIFLVVIFPVLGLIQWLGGDELKVEQGA